MPRCSDSRCSCVIKAGPGASVEGAGRPDNPYVIGVGSGPGGGGGWEPGDIKATARATPAPGWLVCNGAAVSRATYAALFEAIGEAYGNGDGATTFNVPDYSRRFLMGAGGGVARGTAGGSAKLTTAHLPQHNHTIDHDHAPATAESAGNHDHNLIIGSAPGGATSVSRGNGTTDVGAGPINAAGAHTHNVNLPEYKGTSGNAGEAVPSDFVPPFTAALIVIKT